MFLLIHIGSSHNSATCDFFFCLLKGFYFINGNGLIVSFWRRYSCNFFFFLVLKVGHRELTSTYVSSQCLCWACSAKDWILWTDHVMIPVFCSVCDTSASSDEKLYSDTPFSACHATLQQDANDNIPSCKY